MNALQKFIPLVLLSLVTACNDPTEDNYRAITGKWQAADWLVNGRPSGKNIKNVSFQFSDDKTYSSRLGAVTENGIYRIEKNYLYTQAENQMEILVKITKLTADSLTLGMNNAGQEETLILVKSN